MSARIMARGALEGRVILVTRPVREAAELSERLRSEGAEAIEAPAVEIVPLEDTTELDRAARELADGRFAWVVFTSPRGVDTVIQRQVAIGKIGLRARLAAVGPATAERLAERELRVDIVPERFTTAALGEGFPRGQGRVLLPRADIAPPDLEEALADKGWTPVRVDAYRTRLPSRLPPEATRALDGGRVDALVFTSGSTVRGFATMAGVPTGPRVVCIGPVTAEAAARTGFTVDRVAEPHTIEGVVAALEELFRGRP